MALVIMLAPLLLWLPPRIPARLALLSPDI
jgi:hypothetical protein